MLLYTATEVQYICGDAMAPIFFVCGLTFLYFGLLCDETLPAESPRIKTCASDRPVREI